MSVRRRQRWLGSQRIDVPHLRSIESAVSSDFDELLKGFVTGEGRELVVRGFELNMTNAINASASGLQMLVASSTLFHGTSLQSGTFYTVASDASPEILNSTINTKVRGSFTPNAVNYVGIEYERAADDATADTVYFWNPTNKTEFSSNVPLASILKYTIVITTSIWAANVVPVAKVKVSLSGNVESITDQRPMMFRLGSAGRGTPNPDYVYPWTAHSQGRSEESFTASTLGQNPFRGGDKQIYSLKDWMDAIMSSLKEIKGTTYWYSANVPGSLVKMREDLANTVISGRGNISHDSALSGKVNWSDDIYFNVIGSRLAYRILANASSSDLVLGEDEVAYINLIRGVDIVPNIVFTNSSAIVQSVGAIAWTGLLQSGDWIKLSSDDDTKYLKIASVNSASQVTLDAAYTGTSTGSSGTKAQYAFGTYETNAAPSTDRHIKKALRKNVPFTQDAFWFLYRNDNGGATPKVYVRFLGSELEQGEHRQISDNTSQEVLDYMGSPSEVDTSPAYVGPVRSITQSENLTSAINSLDTELDKFFGQLYIKPTLPVSKRVVVTGVDRTMLNNGTISQELANLLLKFDGAEIDFSTGSIYESDGITPLGINFTPVTIGAAKFRWYSVSLIPDTVDSSNRLTVKLLVLPASADGVTADAAPRAAFGGVKKIGQVVVQDDSTGGAGTINNITQSQCVQLGIDFGASKGDKPKLIGGGTFSWNSFTNQLSFTQDIYVEQPRLNYVDNTISQASVSPITLPTTSHVAYIDRLNATSGGPNLTVSVGLITSVKDHQIIIARRSGSDVLVGTSSTLLKNGQSTELYAQESIQSRNTLRSTDYLRSDSPVFWDGSQLSFPSDIILESLNVRTGALKQTTISSSQSPIVIADGQAAIVVIDREAPSGAATVSVVSSVPVITSENQEVIPIARRVDVGLNSYLHILLHKQIIEENQSIRLGQSYAPTGGGGETIYEFPLNNNQSSPANISSFYVSSAESKIFKSEFGISRRYYQDPSLTNEGVLNSNFPTYSSGFAKTSSTPTIYTVIVQPDGKVLVGGDFDSYNSISRPYVARLNSDGSLDTTFAQTGTGFNFIVSCMALQPDGKVLVGGNFTTYNSISRPYVARLNSDGSLDTTFAQTGTGLNSAASALVLQPDGKVLVGGSFTTYNAVSRPYMARLNSDGSLDTAFVQTGTGLGNSVDSIALQPDSKMLISGNFLTYNAVSRPRVARLNSDGSLDTAFVPGTGFSSSPYTISLQSDGRAVFAGGFTTYNGTARNCIARLNSDGSLDMAFAPTGPSGGAVLATAIQPDGKILFGGQFSLYGALSTPRIARLNSDGSLDTTFVQTGTGLNSNVEAIALQSDGQVLVGGSLSSYNSVLRVGLARLTSTGGLDGSFAKRGVNSWVYSVATQSDGKILVGGVFNLYNDVSSPRVARLNSDCSLDTTFAQTGTGLNGDVNCIAIQSDGYILVGGGFNSYNGISRVYIARLNPDGSLDTTFVPTGTGFSGGTVSSIVVQSDGKILVGGSFTSYNGTSRPYVARLNYDGSLDTTFVQTGTGLDGTVRAMALQPDGKVLVGGTFTAYNSISRSSVARLNSDGSLDTTFVQTGTGLNSTIRGLALQPDGKVLVGGGFTAYDGTTRVGIARLTSTGGLDGTFSPTGAGLNNSVYTIAVQTDGKVLIGGLFTTYNSISRSRIARLNSDGSLDTAFVPTGTGFNDTTYAVSSQSDGRVLVGGAFTRYDIPYVNYVSLLGNLTAAVTSEYMTQGALSGIYRPSTSTWEIDGLSVTGNTPEVSLTITSAGQVQYTSSNLPGTEQESKIKFKITKL